MNLFYIFCSYVTHLEFDNFNANIILIFQGVQFFSPDDSTLNLTEHNNVMEASCQGRKII